MILLRIMDPEILSRVQFAVSAGFHFLFPPISIGLGIFLVVTEAIALKTRSETWLRALRFWTKIFALVFVCGVATGIVMEFEFGTNWANYSRFVGDVFGSPLAAEAIFAFFLESSFLAVVIFGWNRVSPRFHFFSTVMVCLGAHLSALWILVANSWMQTPAGYHVVETPLGSRAEITDFWAMVFNPSTLDRLAHVLLAAWLTGAFLVISVSAWHLLKNRHVPIASRTMKVALVFGCVAMVAQYFSGHSSAKLVEAVQPAKFAAMEGVFEKNVPADFHIIGYVDEDAGTVHSISVPGAVSFMLGKGFGGEVKGLNTFPPEDRPPVQLTFQGFHWMVYSGVVMTLLLALGIWFWVRRRLETARWWLVLCVPAAILPQFANQMGWIAAEVGRQPWAVYGLMRTKDAISPNVIGSQVLFSLIFFSLIYCVIFALFVFLLGRKIKQGPEELA